MRDTTKKPADISPVIDINCKYFAANLKVVHCDFERLKLSPHVLQNSTALTLIGACENLLSAASELHQAIIGKGEFESAFQGCRCQAINRDTYGRDMNKLVIADKLQHSPILPKATTTKRIKSAATGDIAQLAKERLENQQKLKAKFAEFKTKDWVQLQLIKSEKAYKGLQVEIDGQQTTIKTFADYCLYTVGLRSSVVYENLGFLKGFGLELFTALNLINIQVRDMRKARKLSAEQKQALLQVAQTGDKAATLAFIAQALQAGEPS